MTDEPRIVSIDITHLVRAALATADSDDESPTSAPLITDHQSEIEPDPSSNSGNELKDGRAGGS